MRHATRVLFADDSPATNWEEDLYIALLKSASAPILQTSN